MNLNIKERIVLAHLVQAIDLAAMQKGNIVCLRIRRKLLESLTFSEEELKEFSLREEGGRYLWDATTDKGKDIEIGDEAHKMIVEKLKELNAQGLLVDDHLSVIDKFPEVEDD